MYCFIKNHKYVSDAKHRNIDENHELALDRQIRHADGVPAEARSYCEGAAAALMSVLRGSYTVRHECTKYATQYQYASGEYTARPLFLH